MKIQRLDLPDEKAAWIRSELDTDERVVWSGEPVPRLFTTASRGIFTFGLPWTAFSFFWMWGASHGSLAFAAFGLPFVFSGLGMLSTPWLAKRRLAKAAYAITDRRGLIVDHSFLGVRTVRSLALRDLTTFVKETHPNGTNDLFFEGEVQTGGKHGPTTTPVGFIGIRDARPVETALRELRDEAAKTAA